MAREFTNDLIKRLKQELKDPAISVREALRKCDIDVENAADYKAAWDFINKDHVIGRRIVRKTRPAKQEVAS